MRRAQGDLPGALQAFTEGMNIRDQLAAADPGNAEWQRDLIVSHWKLADLLERPDRAAEAAGHWSQALAIARTLAATGRLAPTDAYLVETLEHRLAAAPPPPTRRPDPPGSHPPPVLIAGMVRAHRVPPASPPSASPAVKHLPALAPLGLPARRGPWSTIPTITPRSRTPG